MDPQMVEQLTKFGLAGVMAVLWIWERTHSRKRENHLTESHARIVQDQVVVGEVIEIVQQNTRAIEKFDQTQHKLCDLLETVHDQINKNNA